MVFSDGFSIESSIFNKNNLFSTSCLLSNIIKKQIISYTRQTCSCTRPIPQYKSNLLVIDERSFSLCSQYSILRGFHQRVIAISMYGPKENKLFTPNGSLSYLYELIADMTTMYPGWILRVYS